MSESTEHKVDQSSLSGRVVKLVPKQVDCQGIYHHGHPACTVEGGSIVAEADSPLRDAAQANDCQLSRSQYKPVIPEAFMQSDRTNDHCGGLAKFTVGRDSIPVRRPDSQSREPGFKSHCGRFEPLASLITPRCHSSLSCINEYLAIQTVVDM